MTRCRLRHLAHDAPLHWLAVVPAASEFGFSLKWLIRDKLAPAAVGNCGRTHEEKVDSARSRVVREVMMTKRMAGASGRLNSSIAVRRRGPRQRLKRRLTTPSSFAFFLAICFLSPSRFFLACSTCFSSARSRSARADTPRPIASTAASQAARVCKDAGDAVEAHRVLEAPLERRVAIILVARLLGLLERVLQPLGAREVRA